MTKEKSLMELEDKSLLYIIEKAENKEDQNRINAMKELARRKLSPAKINELAILVNQAIAGEMLLQDDISKEEVTMHKSIFLNQEEVKEIYIEQLEKYMKDKEQFRFNVWSYSIGGM
ncbi:MAG: hypothetical protein AB8G15_18225 [Saprospiraceae bacterium]